MRHVSRRNSNPVKFCLGSRRFSAENDREFCGIVPISRKDRAARSSLKVSQHLSQRFPRMISANNFKAATLLIRSGSVIPTRSYGYRILSHHKPAPILEVFVKQDEDLPGEGLETQPRDPRMLPAPTVLVPTAVPLAQRFEENLGLKPLSPKFEQN